MMSDIEKDLINDKTPLNLPEQPTFSNSGSESNHFHTNSSFHEFNLTKRAHSQRYLEKISATDSAPDINPDLAGAGDASSKDTSSDD